VSYTLQFEPDENGTLLVTCKELPEVTTFGIDEEDARRHGAEAIAEALEARAATFDADMVEVAQPLARRA